MFCKRNDRDKNKKQTLECSLLREQYMTYKEISGTKVENKN